MSAPLLTPAQMDRLRVINLFRLGFDTVDIARKMGCREALVANLLAAARDGGVA